MTAQAIKDEVYSAVAENKAMQGRTAQYLANLRYELRRTKLGLCHYSGCREKAPFMCPKHLAVKAAQLRRWNRKKRTK